jgi:hypothetical protein
MLWIFTAYNVDVLAALPADALWPKHVNIFSSCQRELELDVKSQTNLTAIAKLLDGTSNL